MKTNSNNKSSISNSQFEQLKQKYIVNLESKLQTMELAYQQKDQVTLIEFFHKLKGNGKTYGFALVSEVGSILDEHHKKQSSNYLYWAQLGILLLKQLREAYLQQQDINWSQVPEYQELTQSVKSVQKGIS